MSEAILVFGGRYVEEVDSMADAMELAWKLWHSDVFKRIEVWEGETCFVYTDGDEPLVSFLQERYQAWAAQRETTAASLYIDGLPFIGLSGGKETLEQQGLRLRAHLGRRLKVVMPPSVKEV